MKVTALALHKNTLTFLCASVLFLAAVGYAYANPGNMENPVVVAETSFANMDANKDGKVVSEEFFKLFPNMREAAFTAIDKNNDGSITLEEWKAFYVGHSQDTADHSKMVEDADAQAGQTGQAGQGQKPSDDGTPDLVMPADGK